MADEFTRNITVDACYLSEIRSNVEKLSKIAAKLGLDPVILTVNGFEVETRERVDPYTRVRRGTFDVEVVHLTITGQTPVLPSNWTFLGAIEHLSKGNIVHGDDERLSAYRTADANCDHCKVSRQRAKTVVVVNEDGDLAQVGSTCLKDYLGYHNDPEQLFDYVSRAFDEERLYGAREPDVRNVLQVLAATAYAIRKTGWRSLAQAREERLTATSEIVSVLVGFTKLPANKKDPLFVLYEEHFKDDPDGITDEDRATALAVREWAHAIPLDTPSNYLHSVWVSVEEGAVIYRNLGLVVSAQGAMQREKERAISSAEKKANAPIAVPVVEGRQTIVGTVVSTKLKFSRYGDVLKMLVSVPVEDGAFRVWGSVPSALFESVEAGVKIRFDATVERSDNDPAFGFFSRPTKAAVLATA